MTTNGNGHGDAGKLEHELERWNETLLAKALKRGGEREAEFRTTSTVTDRLYTPLDVADVDYDRDIGAPGEYPYTRGVQPTMYRGRLWSIRQYAGFGTAKESNERFKFLLGQGQTGLSVAFDLPTQIGMDSDDPNADAEIGQVGVAIDSLADMEEMFEGIPLDRVSTSMTINAPAPVLVAMYLAVAEKQGVPAGDVMGTAQNDVLKEYVARGTYIYPPRQSLRFAADLITYCAKYAPKFNSISVSGYHIRDAGSTAAQEMAFAFANAIAYLEACQRSGIGVDEVAPRISWIFNTHNNFFEEVAKYRALRRMWSPPARALRRDGPEFVEAAHAHPDRRRDAHRAAAGKQYRARVDSGTRFRARRRAVNGALVLRRSARDPDDRRATDRPSHAADHRPRNWGHRHGRSVRRFLLRRSADG